MSRYNLRLTITDSSNNKEEFNYELSSKKEAEVRAEQVYFALISNVKKHAGFSVSRSNWFYLNNDNVPKIEINKLKYKLIGTNNIYYHETPTTEKSYVFELFESTFFI